jgi:hypothetical protein
VWAGLAGKGGGGGAEEDTTVECRRTGKTERESDEDRIETGSQDER